MSLERILCPVTEDVFRRLREESTSAFYSQCFELLQALVLFGVPFRSREGVCRFISGRKSFIELAFKKPASDAVSKFRLGFLYQGLK